MERLGIGAGAGASFKSGRVGLRRKLPFRAVNRRDRAGFTPGMQRHHLLPWQLLAGPAFRCLFETIGRERLDFDDFRSNGLLLPARGDSAFSGDD